MNVIELLEATKVEVDKRWERGYQLWDQSGETDCACVLGCLGFARWDEQFSESRDFQESGYGLLRDDPDTFAAIQALAKNSRGAHIRYDPLEAVYRENDAYFNSKQAAKDFVDLALADLRE